MGEQVWYTCLREFGRSVRTVVSPLLGTEKHENWRMLRIHQKRLGYKVDVTEGIPRHIRDGPRVNCRILTGTEGFDSR